MATMTVHNHRRIQQSALAPAERTLLQALAGRMPDWLNSDHLTLLGVLGTVLAALGYSAAQSSTRYLYLASFGIVLNWFGDSLDGTLARFRRQLRPRYGYYVDHILDSLGAAILVVGLILGGFMSVAPAAAFLVVYLLLNIHVYLATTATGEFKISFGLVGPTELRIGMIVGNFFLATHPVVSLSGRQFLLFDVGAVVGVVVLLSILAISAGRMTRRLYRLETRPHTWDRRRGA